jgi:protein involved in ribonucleotide reduction
VKERVGRNSFSVAANVEEEKIQETMQYLLLLPVRPIGGTFPTGAVPGMTSDFLVTRMAGIKDSHSEFMDILSTLAT